MRVIIAGGRDFSNYRLLQDKCREFIGESADIEIVSGGARGADSLGEAYAREQGIALKVFRADWGKLGKIAGFVRNEQMAVYASQGEDVGMLIAFWDGKSEGTGHMIDLAFRYGLKVHVVSY